MCLAGTMVVSWFVTQEVEGSNTPVCKHIFTSSTDSIELI